MAAVHATRCWPGRVHRPVRNPRLPEVAGTELGASPRPAAVERLANLDAFLSRSDLRDLGLERRSIDVIFRSLPVVAIPGVRRVYVRADDLRAFIDEHTYDGRTEVRPT